MYQHMDMNIKNFKYIEAGRGSRIEVVIVFKDKRGVKGDKRKSKVEDTVVVV